MYEILSLYLIAFAVACLEMCFQFIQTEGQILQWYGDWWKHRVRYKRLLSRYGKKYPLVFFLAYISKPMGLCEYCNGIWLSIITGLIMFGLQWYIFLFMGVTWFFIRLMSKYHLI